MMRNSSRPRVTFRMRGGDDVIQVDCRGASVDRRSIFSAGPGRDIFRIGLCGTANADGRGGHDTCRAETVRRCEAS